MGLFRFFRGVGDYAAPNHDAAERAGEMRETHTAYHKRIVHVSGAFGVVGAIVGVVLAVAAASNEEDATGILLGPFIFCAAGLLFGVAVACLFAPQEFLTGPMGEKWLQLIGTKSVLTARIVCLIFGLIIVLPVIGIGLLILFAD